MTMTKEFKQLDNAVFSELKGELDHSLGGIWVNIEVLEAMKVELARISERVNETDKGNMTDMSLCFHDIHHKITIIDSLLNHTVNKLRGHYEECNVVKQSLYDYEIKKTD